MACASRKIRHILCAANLIKWAWHWPFISSNKQRLFGLRPEKNQKISIFFDFCISCLDLGLQTTWERAFRQPSNHYWQSGPTHSEKGNISRYLSKWILHIIISIFILDPDPRSSISEGDMFLSTSHTKSGIIIFVYERRNTKDTEMLHTRKVTCLLVPLQLDPE